MSTKSLSEFKVVRVPETPSVFRDIPAEDPARLAAFWRTHVCAAPWHQPDKEMLVVATLNMKLRITGFNLVSMGCLNEAMAHPREILRPVIVAAAYRFVLMHNHPSGDPTPSSADHSVTGGSPSAPNSSKSR